MAISTDKKLYIAIGVLVLAGGAVYLQSQKQSKEAEAHSQVDQAKNLPKLELKDEQLKKVDRVTLTQPAGDAGLPTEVVLVKKGEEWELEKPVAAKANQANVKSLLDNLKTLKVTDVINPDASAYAKYKVSDDTALHAVFKAGSDTVADYYFGEGGSRGQMTRFAGKDGVFAVDGYSSFLYSRDLKDWRDREIFKFEEKDATAVEIENENGVFSFEKSGDTWAAKFKKPKGAAATKLDRFDSAKVEDLLRAYKALSANDFARDKKPEDIGLATPKAKLTITMKDGGKKILYVGDKAEGSDRYAKAEGSDAIITVSSFAADWATAEPSKFQKPDDKKDKDKDKDKPKAGEDAE